MKSDEEVQNNAANEASTAERITAILAEYAGKRAEVIVLLQRFQKEFGYLSEESMKAIARFTRVPPSSVYGAATFYSQFRFSPIGRHHVLACRGTACHVKGAPKILDEIKAQLHLDEGGVTDDGEFSLETVACIGACGLAPTMVVDGKTYGRLTAKKAAEIIAPLRR